MTMSQTRHYEMKDSGFGDIREMPKHWQMLRIKNRYSVLCGATPSENSENWDGDINWIGPADMGDFGKIKEGKRTITQTGYDSCGTHLIPAGSVILSTRAPIGKVQIAEAELCTNQGCKSMVRMFTDDSTQFLAYYLFAIKERLQEAGTGTTFKELSTANLKNMPFLLPSPQEQTAIAAYLDKKCATIDAIIAEAKATIEEYKAWKASVIFEAVTKGLNPDAKMKDSGVGWIGEMPKHWITKRGKNILRLLSRPVRPDDEIVTCFRDGEVTLRKNRREEGFTNALVEAGYQGVEPGDLVVHGMDGFAGSIGVSDSRGKASPVLNVMDSSENKRYLMYYLRGIAMREVFLALSTGIRVRSCDLRWNKLAVLPYIVPPLPEQTAIAAYLDSKCAAIDSVIAEKEALISDLETYKKSLIFETVTGKRRVC